MRQRWITAALAAALVMAAVGCGDDGDGSTGSTNADPTSTTAGPTGDPILIGFINAEGGALSVPEIRYGAEAALAHINEGGGVHGRPLELLRCDTDGSPEKSIDCANQMVEKRVTIVQFGTDPGGDAALPILTDAGIPLIGNLSAGTAQLSAPNATWMGVPSPAFAVGPLAFYAQQGVERVRFFMLDLPATHAFDENVISPAAQALGLDFKTIFYTAGADWSVLAATAMADQPDVIGTAASPEPDCIGMVGGLRDAGWDGPIYGGICSEFVSELPEQAVGATIVSTAWRIGDPDSIPADRKADAATFRTAMAAAGHEELSETDSYAVGGFLVTMNLAKIMGGIEGSIEPESVLAALHSTVDFDSFLGPKISCDGSAWPGTSACSNQMVFYEIEEGGRPTLAGDGFVELSAG